MSVSEATKTEMKVDEALRGATADQLRRELKRKVTATAVDPSEPGDFISATEDRFIDDDDSFINSRDYWRRGDKREALHYLELALGRDFIGLGDLRPEDLR